jgi:TetR/AcrR family transcriptional regulator
VLQEAGLAGVGALTGSIQTVTLAVADMPTAALASRPTARRPAARRAVPARDPQRTQDRILSAALEEFAAEGFAGARVARIARRARINKRMLYHYFGNKEGLFHEILDRKLRERASWVTEAPTALGESLVAWFQMACEDQEFIRLLQWEALRAEPGPVQREPERRASILRAIGDLRERQRAGLLPEGLDAGHLLLAILGLVAYPLAFPQVTRLVTGRSPSDPAFRRQRAAFLRAFSDALGRGPVEAAGRPRP